MKTKKVYPLLGSTFIVTSMLAFGLISGASGVEVDSKEKASGSSTGIESGAIPQGAASEGEVEATPAQAPGTTSSGAATGAGGTPREGVKIHGHWSIEVRDPDGTVVTRREFDNALVTGGVPSGGSFLADVITRTATFGQWRIHLDPSGGNPLVCDPDTCTIAEPFDSTAPASGSTNLTVVKEASGETVLLSGSVAAVVDSSIGGVRTVLGVCSNDTPPATCASAAGAVVLRTEFTRTLLLTPIPVVAGQIIQVNVTLSFS